MNTIVKNFSWVLIAQIVVLLISVGRAIILPKFLSVEDYGYWEIYWFYSCYVALFCLGYNDGIYLQYGECNYSQLPIKSIRSANRLLLKILGAMSLMGVTYLLSMEPNENFRISYSFVFLNIPIVCITGVLIYIFQITNSFKEYSLFSTIDKVFVFIIIIALVLLDKAYYPVIIIADFIGRLFVVGMMIVKKKDLFFGDVDSYSQAWQYMFSNMRIGIKLMIANLMGMLLIGAGKIIVQVFGGISDFATYSFGLSITGLILTAVTAISLVLYPTIKRIDKDRYQNIFKDLSKFTRLLGFISLLVYFPCYFFISYYYTKYSSILPYMNFFFVIVFANIKISVLNNTFYKVLRKEKAMLRANIGCIIFFILICLIGYSVVSELWIVACCTSVALLMRYALSEIYLANSLNVKRYWGILFEISILSLFLTITGFFRIQLSFLLFGVIICIWCGLTAKRNYQLVTRLIN